MKRPICHTCVYLNVDYPSESSEPPRFECRYEPPSIPCELDGAWYRVWGETRPDGWCGRHQDFPQWMVYLDEQRVQDQGNTAILEPELVKTDGEVRLRHETTDV